ncbi:MAG: WD40 repeat domain-containing protein [Gemmataceae bacterium]
MSDQITNRTQARSVSNLPAQKPDEDRPRKEDPLGIWSWRNILLTLTNSGFFTLMGFLVLRPVLEMSFGMTGVVPSGLIALIAGGGLGLLLSLLQIRRAIGRGIRTSTQPLPHGPTLGEVTTARSRSAEQIVQGGVSVVPIVSGPRKHLRRFTGHEGPITALTVSPDGRLAASADEWTRTTLLWDLETGYELQTFHGFKAVIHSLAFSPDGQLLAGAGADTRGGRDPGKGAVRIWDARTGQELRRFEIAGDQFAIRFLPDGKHVLLGGYSYLRLWEIDGPSPVAMIDLQQGIKLDAIRAVSLSRDGRSALGGCTQSEDARLVNLDTLQEVRAFKRQDADGSSLWTATMHSVAFSPDGLRVLTGNQDRKIRVHNLAGTQLLSVMDPRGWWGWRGVVGTEWLDDQRFVSVNRHGHLCVWNAATGERLATFNHGGTVSALAVTPRGDITLTAGRDAIIRLWDV